MNSVPRLISDPDATARTLAAFAGTFGGLRLMPLPPLNASEDAGLFGTAAVPPAGGWFWGGLETESTPAVRRAGRLEPCDHSPEFAPVLEPALNTGIQALTVATLAWQR
ncbi:hypothetical protein ACFRI7_31915 [Streptomyces sp. NPDC056716]|uniref:hypothetical protein n=1 Tax=unclassified Streptomyces TaxID=2593676 RepID=UPI00367CC842